MTTHQKIRMGISITLLVVSVICAIFFALAASAYNGLETPEVETEGPLESMGVMLYVFTMATGLLYFMLLLCGAGLVLAVGSTLLGFNLYTRLAGGGGIALHTGLLIYFFVTYGETLTTLA